MSIGTLIQTMYIYIYGVSKIMGTFLGVSIIRTIGLYWGPLVLRNYHMGNLIGFHG